jgi:hypothetical protein
MGEVLGEILVKEALALLPKAPVSYGKAAIVGSAGETEHAAALLHPHMGKPMRAAVGGGKAIITSNVKVAAASAEIDVPLTDKDDVWNFDRIDTVTVTVPGAPRADEVVVIVAVSDGGRVRPRVKAGGLKSAPGGVS